MIAWKLFWGELRTTSRSICYD